MQQKLTVVYDDIYLDWKLGPGDGSHPTNPMRAKLATELLVASLGKQVRVIKPNLKARAKRDLAALKQTHNPDYVDRTISGENSEWWGNKPSVGQAGFAMFQGTIRALESILSGKSKVAFNPQGAKHHARFDFGSGFCVFNDMAWAAKTLLDSGMRPLYIDWDIHAGDGVMHMLKGFGVPTISIHNAMGYPGDREMQTLDGTRAPKHDKAGHNYNFNVLEGDGDDVFKQYIDAAAGIVDEYQPNIILVAAGADGHTGVGNLGAIANYTSDGFRYAAEMIADKALAYADGRVLLGGAGGYQPLKETPETWALVVETIFSKVRQANVAAIKKGA